MTIRDGMTSKLNRIFQAVSRTNRALETTDALSDQVNPGANFDRAVALPARLIISTIASASQRKAPERSLPPGAL